uniref:Uncharacterized protein n=1 Tax=Solanum tuberosum TaxID=4113 RepID=M1DBE5_SOLTU
MSSTQRYGKVVASSSRKRERTSTTVPPAPAVPRGQTQRYGANVVTSEGKKWYKSHTEAKYFSIVILDDVQLEREFPRIMRHLQELRMGFIFQDPTECNVSMVREFYANWKPDARSHCVTVRGVEIQHTLCGAQSTVKWIRHRHRGYHQSYPYAHMNREVRVGILIDPSARIRGSAVSWVKSKEECAKKGHLDKGRKIEDEVAEENCQEAGKYTRRDAELKLACRK